MTRTGEWEICSVSRRLPDYPGEVAYMHSEVKDFFRTQMLLLWQLLIEMFHLFFEPTRSTFRFFLGLGFSFYTVNFLSFRGNRVNIQVQLTKLQENLYINFGGIGNFSF